MSNSEEEIDEKRCIYCKKFIPIEPPEIELKKNKIYENERLVGYCCLNCLYKFYLGDDE